MKNKNLFIPLIIITAIAVGGYYYWLKQGRTRLPDGLIETNGRIEAEQVEISAKAPGRITEILVNEGDIVTGGTVLARMDDKALQAQIMGAKALVNQALQLRKMFKAVMASTMSQRTLAYQEYDRASDLHKKGHISTAVLDQRRSQKEFSDATYDSAQANFDQASAAVQVAEASVAQLNSLLEDTILIAPRGGRIQYKLAQAGEVVGAGARILTLLDITDVYMTVFIPAKPAGRLAIGSEARLILDPVPQYVIPAKVTFVASEAQFTPKAVETPDERDKLMFRVKLTLDPELLKKNQQKVKTGIRGTVYIAVDSNVEWPESLAIKLPE